MFSFFVKVLISSIIISFASWLSFKKPQISGFIVALPLVSIISLAFSFLEHQDKDKTILFAKSIVVGIPASLLFFVPFFFSKMFSLNFWTTYILGLMFLVLGFYIHKFITQLFQNHMQINKSNKFDYFFSYNIRYRILIINYV